MSFQRLLGEIRKCRLCEPSLPLAPRPVIQASVAARILVCSQAPGIRVHETGIPFNDPSGDRLREWMGIDREIFYDENRIAIIPMGFCYPGRAPKGGDLPPRPECATTWHERIFSYYGPDCLKLVIGQYAHTYHLGKGRYKNLTETVRNWRHFWPGIVPLPHPSPRNNMWLRRNPWFETDVIPALQDRIRQLL